MYSKIENRLVLNKNSKFLLKFLSKILNMALQRTVFSLEMSFKSILFRIAKNLCSWQKKTHFDQKAAIEPKKRLNFSAL